MWQDIAALTTVALTAATFLYRSLRRRSAGQASCSSCGNEKRIAAGPTYLIPTTTLTAFKAETALKPH